MSGSLFAPWARVTDPAAAAGRLARALNCSGDIKEKETLQCLRAAPAATIAAATSADDQGPPFRPDPFGPSYDGVTVKDNFSEMKGKRSFGTRYVC